MEPDERAGYYGSESKEEQGVGRDVSESVSECFHDDSL